MKVQLIFAKSHANLTGRSTRTPTQAMPSAFSWPVSVPSALRAPAPVGQGVSFLAEPLSIPDAIRMKRLIFAALLFMSANCFAQNSFTCNYGQRPACLGYSDKVVDSNAACFNQYACGIGGGFVCKSKLDEAMDDYNTLVRKYNELLKKHKELADTGTSLVDSYRELETSLNDCRRKQRSTENDLSDLEDQLRKSKMEADELRSENVRLLTELRSLRQQMRKTSK